MFGHRTSRRFAEEDRDPKPGPGAYNLPTALDDKAPSMEGSQRWQEGSAEMPGPGEYEVSPDSKQLEPLTPVPTQRRALTEKENRCPSAGSLRKGKSAIGGARSPREGLFDAEKPRRDDARVTAQLETMRDELKQKSRENKDLQSMVTSKDHKVEELQRRVENALSEKREAQKKILEVESERDGKRRQLHEKEQELQSLQRKSEHNRATAEERKRTLERKDEEQKAHIAEVQRMKTQVDLLQERVSTSERDRNVADARVELAERESRQHEKRIQEQESAFKEHVAVLEESLRREEARRRALEERDARSGAQLEQGGQDLAAQRQRAEELQRRVIRLEEEARQEARRRLVEQDEHRQSQSRVENELAALKAKGSVQAESLQHAEETRKELDARVVHAEVAKDTLEKEVSTLAQHKVDLDRRVAELEGELQQFGEVACSELRSKLTSAEESVERTKRELGEERNRSEDLERRLARAEEEVSNCSELRSKLTAAEEKVEGTKRDLGEERDRSEDLERRLARAEEEVGQAQRRAEKAETLHDPRLFEQRALRAEEELSVKDVELRRLQEWADEQNLRELTAETERIKELERVRQDVTKQVSAARDEVVNENRALQQRMKDLETGPHGAETLKLKLADQEQELKETARALADAEAGQADIGMQLEQAKHDLREKEKQLHTSQASLEDAGRNFEEEKRTLENRINHLEADASVVADEAAEERERVEAQLKAVKIEYEISMNTRVEEEATSRAAERQATAQQLHALEESLSQLRTTGASCKWRLLAEASTVRQLVQAAEADWPQVLRAVWMWRARASGHERDADQLARQSDELERLDMENESLNCQNRQMLLSLQQSQGELQWSLAEMKRLQEKEAEYEAEIMGASERNAALAGHNNSKQKIKHVVDLKQQMDNHRQKNKQAHQRIKQLEAMLRNASFYETLVVGAGANSAELSDVASTPAPPSRSATPSKQRNLLQLSVTPGRTAPRTPMRGSDKERDLERGADDAARRARQEQVRHAKAHSRASERAAAEYQHLAAVCEQVLSLATVVPTWQRPIAVSSTVPSSGTQTPVCGSEVGLGGADSKQLLQRLRELASNMSTGTAQAPQEATAPASSSKSGIGERTPLDAPQETDAEAEDSEEAMPEDCDDRME